MTVNFIYDERLGISVPHLKQDWDTLSLDTQENTLLRWENIRGHIPDRIKDLEDEINKLQQCLYEEEEFEKSCQINNDISDLASIINDLWIWYRTGEHVNVKLHN